MLNKSSQGVSERVWKAAKLEAKTILIECAKARKMIAYSDLAAKIVSLRMQAHDIRLFHLLGQVSSEEDAAGRGMLTVIVIHKNGDMQPGPGFFDLAEYLGRNTSDILACWADELNKVYAAWSGRR